MCMYSVCVKAIWRFRMFYHKRGCSMCTCVENKNHRVWKAKILFIIWWWKFAAFCEMEMKTESDFVVKIAICFMSVKS